MKCEMNTQNKEFGQKLFQQFMVTLFSDDRTFQSHVLQVLLKMMNQNCIQQRKAQEIGIWTSMDWGRLRVTKHFHLAS